MLLNEQHLVVSFFCELFGGASINESFLDPAFNALDGCDAALAGTDVQAAADSISGAEAQVNAAVETLAEYQSKLFEGGATTITVIQVTSTALMAVASVAGGAILVTTGTLGPVGASAAAGGYTTLAVALPAHTTSIVGLEDETIGEATIKTLIETGLNAGGAALAARCLPGVSQQLSGYIYAKLAPKLTTDQLAALGGKEALMLMVNNAAQGGLGNAIQGVFGDVRGLVTKETSWQDFFGHIATNLIAGGITGAILGQTRFQGRRGGREEAGGPEARARRRGQRGEGGRPSTGPRRTPTTSDTARADLYAGRIRQPRAHDRSSRSRTSTHDQAREVLSAPASLR